MLANKVIAITGAARGIGREIALLAARKGASVVVNDFGGSAEGEGTDSALALEVVREIEAAGGNAIANGANVADPDAAASIIQDAVDKFGRIDAVVNNAGILRDCIFHRMSQKEWKPVIDVHLNGSFNVASAAAKFFRAQGSGSFVNFTSSSGLIGNFGQANYSAAKLGIVALSKSIALDMERFGVTSNCISPFAWSRLIATIPTETEDDKLRVERAMSMTAEKIAPLVAYLCSDAAKGVTGQVFGVRKNEIFLFDSPRPIRAMQRSDGWTVESIAQELIPAFQPSFQKLDRSGDVFSWDPV